MNKYVSLDKRSKKAQREYHAKQRRTWGELNPVTWSVPSGKTYNRKKEKQRIGKEFRNGFDADLLARGEICEPLMYNEQRIYKQGFVAVIRNALWRKKQYANEKTVYYYRSASVDNCSFGWMCIKSR